MPHSLDGGIGQATADAPGDCAHLQLFHPDFHELIREHCARCRTDPRTTASGGVCMAERMRFLES